MLPDILRVALVACWLPCCIGCSSLGLSCYPTGHFLTKQSEAVLSQSPIPVHVPRELEQGVVPTHFLQPGDVLLIQGFDSTRDLQIPADQQVLIDGSIDLGPFGRVIAAGLTLEMCENLIQRTIVDAGQENTPVNVQLLEPVSRYYVLGEVQSPGSYPLQGNETVLDGLLAAGGLTSAAAPCKILLARPTRPSSCRLTLPVCYREITQMGDTTTNYQLQPGDRIFVASRSWCEELMFWHATQCCPRCRDCQSACVDPAIVEPVNPISSLATASGAVLQASDAPGTLHQPPARNSDPDPSVSTGPAGDSSLPTRLPTEADGQLDFRSLDSSDRFQPLWIKPAPGNELTEPSHQQ